MTRKVVIVPRAFVQEELFEEEEEGTRELDPVTGFIPDTDQHIITLALMDGGESRAEIAERVAELLEPYTRRGKPKQVVNLVANVIGKLQSRGWTIESHFRLVPPLGENADSGE